MRHGRGCRLSRAYRTRTVGECSALVRIHRDALRGKGLTLVALSTILDTGRAQSQPAAAEQRRMTSHSQKKASLMTFKVSAKRAVAQRISITGAYVQLARSPPVSERNAERRRFSRVLFSGALCWQPRGRVGTAEVLDLSEAGAGLAVPQREAVLFVGGHLSLQIELGPNMSWQVTRDARVAEIVPRDAETCRVCVEFPPEQLDEAP